MSKLQTWIPIFTLHSEYVALFFSVRELIPLNFFIKEVIDNLGIGSENMKFVSSSTVYEDNNGAIVVTTSPRMNLTPNQIPSKYYWFRQHSGKELLIRKTESENQKTCIFTKGLQDELFVRIKKLICGW